MRVEGRGLKRTSDSEGEGRRQIHVRRKAMRELWREREWGGGGGWQIQDRVEEVMIHGVTRGEGKGGNRTGRNGKIGGVTG